MVLALLKQAIQRNSSTSKGFLIDGYPRELDQGKRFEAEVAPVERVIYFQVSSVSFVRIARSITDIASPSVCLSVWHALVPGIVLKRAQQ